MHEVFIDEMTKHVGHNITNPWLQGDSSSGAEGSTGDQNAGAQAPGSLCVPETVSQMKSKLFQAEKWGFTAGNHASLAEAKVIEIFQIREITEESAKLVEQVAGKDGKTEIVLLDVLLKKWRVHKGKVMKFMRGWDGPNALSNKAMPLNSTTWGMEAAKSAVILALRQEFSKHQEMLQHLEIYQDPVTVMSKTAFKVGQLQIPAASQRIEQKHSTGALNLGTFTIGGQDVPIYLAPHFQSPFNTKGEANKNQWVCPFWAVGADEKAPTMKLTQSTHEIEGYTMNVPVLVNIKGIAAGDVLTWNKKDIKAKRAGQGGEPSKRPKHE